MKRTDSELAHHLDLPVEKVRQIKAEALLEAAGMADEEAKRVHPARTAYFTDFAAKLRKIAEDLAPLVVGAALVLIALAGCRWPGQDQYEYRSHPVLVGNPTYTNSTTK